MKIQFTIYGKPTYKKRPRSRIVDRGAIGSFVQTYSDPEQQQSEKTIQAIAMQNRPPQLLEGQLGARITAYFPIPKSVSKKKKAKMMAATVRPTVKPDCDNLAKIYLDALNQIIYSDDKQIVSLTVKKFYDLTPRVEIEISTLMEITDVLGEQNQVELSLSAMEA
jgi:Holliday junction resolvase RusA-like endonuclease